MKETAPSLTEMFMDLYKKAVGLERQEWASKYKCQLNATGTPVKHLLVYPKMLLTELLGSQRGSKGPTI